MSRFIFAAVLALSCATVSAQATSSKPTPSSPANQAVITLDFQGSRMKRIDDSPTLSIYADGRVVMPQTYAHTRGYTGQLTPAEMQSLLDLVVNKHQFFQYDERKAAAKLAALPGPVTTLPGHLATTVIRVNTGDASKTVSYYGLGNQRTVPETEHLLAIRTRLEQIMSIMKLGGTQEASRWLDLANRELRTDDPKATPLSLTDLRSAAVHNDGSAYVRFARVSPQGDKSVSVSISMTESGESNIAVAHNDLLSRPPNEIH